ncbi:MAG: HDIG domain-containing protein [Bacteroidales bacterium]|nr:HDIG domain-containing protein [Bacteroidales bacterium]
MNNILTSAAKRLSLIYRIVAMLITAMLIVVLFPHTRHGEHYDYKVGAVWRGADLVAPYDFAVMLTADETRAAEEAERQKAMLYYREDSSARDVALTRLERMGHTLTAGEKRALRRQMDSVYRIGYLELPADVNDMDNHSVVVMRGAVGSMHRSREFINALDLEPGLLRDSLLQPNLVLDAARTTLELDSRLSQLSHTSQMVMAGDRIIAKGEEVTVEKGQIIKSLEAENDRRFSEKYSLWGQMWGQLLLAVIAFVALYMFLKNTRHPILEDDRKVLFVMLLILLMSAVVALVVRVNPEWVLLVPLCIVPILMRVFFDMRVALYIHLTTVIILANLVPNSFEFIFYQLVTGMMSIIAVRNLERRSQFFVLALVIFLCYSFIYTAGVLSQDTNLLSLSADKYLMFFLNAILTLLAYPLIYLFEKLFGITTNLTLLELSSTNTPALRELSRRAPGTFQHSMQVANIAEDLMNEIDGDALLAKVGALYHDIGKVNNPLYFTENQNSGFNPHNELDYVESAEIITSHVTDGLELARKYHLPAEVQDFIRTHHGTTYTGYFYAKELERHPDGGFETARFRYPGPRPYSRETAVVMIVDTVEAALRSLKNHTKEETDAMVDRLIDSKISAGQLDNCPLTYGDIARIRKFLKDKMMSIYHVRVEYPTVKDGKQTSEK